MLDVMMLAVGIIWGTLVFFVGYRYLKKVYSKYSYNEWRRRELSHQFDVYIESLRQGHFKKP